MVYILGYFSADGTMFVNKRGGHCIEFYSTDKYLIEMTRRTLKSTHHIGVRTPNKKRSKHKTAYRIQIGSKEMFADLCNLGFVQNKSKFLVFPEVPAKYMPDFVRGYFDGDGCVYFKKHLVKGRKKKKWVFATRFTCGHRPFLVSLLKTLHTQGLQKGFIMGKHNHSGFEPVFSHRDSVALYGILYNNLSDSDIFLGRKHRLFTRALETLYGNLRA